MTGLLNTREALTVTTQRDSVNAPTAKVE